MQRRTKRSIGGIGVLAGSIRPGSASLVPLALGNSFEAVAPPGTVRSTTDREHSSSSLRSRSAYEGEASPLATPSS
ncbi:MAG TPA: hypothetical protein VG993_01530 [Actinomycetota bacterium]|jgi:hypothetical protein|nr:hypothetical protein [Actinomycetota bacterium]